MNPIKQLHFSEDQLKIICPDLISPASVIARGDQCYAVDQGVGLAAFRCPPDKICSAANGLSKPNGVNFINDNVLLVGDMQQQRVSTLDLHSGEVKVLADNIDGKPLGKVNYAVQDSAGRIWFTVSTHQENHLNGLSSKVRDGYIAKIEHGQVEIVADGLGFPNEIRLDHDEKFVYVAETTQRFVSRFEMTSQGVLSNKTVFGPSHYGCAGFPDGLRFDCYGNLWVTLVMAEKIIALTPEGECHEIFSAGKPKIMTLIDDAFEQGPIPVDLMAKAQCAKVPLITSVAFAGEQSEVILIGHAGGQGIGYYKSDFSW